MPKEEFNEKLPFHIKDCYQKRSFSNAEKVERWFDDIVLALTNNTSEWTAKLTSWKSNISYRIIVLESWKDDHTVVGVNAMNVVSLIRNNPERFQSIIDDRRSMLYGCKVLLTDATK